MGSEANQGLKQGPRLVRTQGEGQAGQRPRLLPLTAPQQQKAGAVAGHIVDRISEHLQSVIAGGIPGGDGGPKAASLDQTGRLGGGTGGQLQGGGEVGPQPKAALRQRLGMGQHLADALQGAAAQEGMADGQHQSPGHRQLWMLPEGIQAGAHPTLH